MSARILTDGAHLSDGAHMSGDEVRDTVLASVGLWRDETGILVATHASPGGAHLVFDPASLERAGTNGTSGPVRLAAAVVRYLATVTHPDDRPPRPGQRWLLMLDGGYPSPVTGIPIIDCTVCGRRHPETRRHCPICGMASLFSHETHAQRGGER